MNLHILLAGDGAKQRKVIEKATINSEWQVQMSEVSDSESEIYSALEEEMDIIILQVKETPNFWQLIQKLRSEHKNLEIILVSQKPDFNLAYQEIQYRVPHFLLEPVEASSYIPIFIEIAEKHRMMEAEKEKEQKLMSYELEQHQKLMAKIMIQMMEKPEELAVMMGEVNERYHTKLKNTYFFVIQIVIMELIHTRQREQILQSVQNICQERLSLGNEIIFSSQYQFDIRAVVNMESNYVGNELLVRINELVQDLSEFMSKNGCKEWTIGVGPIVETVREVQNSADWAIHALHDWNQSRSEHLFNSMERKSEREEKVILDSVKKKQCLKYLRQLQLKELEQFLEDVVNRQDLIEDSFDVQRLVLEIIQLVRDVWGTQMNKKELEDLLSVDMFQYFFDNQKKITKLIQILEELGSSVKNQQKSEKNPQILNALDYIREHYNEMITLEKVALEVDLSPNYFSNLFREETGVNYLDYVTEFRLDQSKILLEKTDWTLEQISNEVGYRDVKYYSQLFKRHYDITPGKYRKKMKSLK